MEWAGATGKQGVFTPQTVGTIQPPVRLKPILAPQPLSGRGAEVLRDRFGDLRQAVERWRGGKRETTTQVDDER